MSMRCFFEISFNTHTHTHTQADRSPEHGQLVGSSAMAWSVYPPEKMVHYYESDSSSDGEPESSELRGTGGDTIVSPLTNPAPPSACIATPVQNRINAPSHDTPPTGWRLPPPRVSARDETPTLVLPLAPHNAYPNVANKPASPPLDGVRRTRYRRTSFVRTRFVCTSPDLDSHVLFLSARITFVVFRCDVAWLAGAWIFAWSHFICLEMCL